MRRSKVSIQITESELYAAASYSKYEKYSFGSVIFDFKAQTKGRRERKRKGKEEEGKKEEGKGGNGNWKRSCAETEKIANAPAGNRTRDPSKRG